MRYYQLSYSSESKTFRSLHFKPFISLILDKILVQSSLVFKTHDQKYRLVTGTIVTFAFGSLLLTLSERK